MNSTCVYRKAMSSASLRKRIIECPNCARVMRTCSEVGEAADNDHLYVMSASERLPGIVKIGRSRHVLQRACDLQEAMPFHINIHCIFWGAGHREPEM